MAQCVRCQHQLGIGRYCMNCGYPVDGEMPSEEELATWRTDTNERPAVSTATQPPPAFEPPPAARFPLYADESPRTRADSDEIVLATLARGRPPEHGRHGSHERPATRTRRRGFPWIPVLAALVVVGLFGAWLLINGSPDGTGVDPLHPEPSRSDASGRPTSSQPDEPSSGPSPSGRADDVARTATVDVPATAPASRDVSGNAVRYSADNMLDGVPSTAWRMPGSGQGEELVVHLEQPARITTVGLVNGYAKDEPGYDGYAANRRVLQVEWVFDDGSVVAQSLREARGAQTIDIAPVETSTVRIRLVEVSAPGTGRTGRDFTAVSELVLRGQPT